MNKKSVIIIGEENRASMGTFLARLSVKSFFMKNIGELTPDLLCENLSLIVVNVYPSQNDGFEILSEIRSNNRIKDIPVIFFSEKKDEEHLKKSYELGVLHYITKPFDTDTCYYKIRNMINTYPVTDSSILEPLKLKAFLADLVVNNSNDGVVITDPKGVIEYVNDTFTKISGFKRKDVFGRKPDILMSNKHNKEFYKKIWSSIIKNGIYKGEIVTRKKNGEFNPIFLSISVVKNEMGDIKKYVGIFHEVKVKTKERNDNRDPLTNLPSINLLKDRLIRLTDGSRRSSSMIAFLLVDIGNLGNINKEHGHSKGDKLIFQFSKRLGALTEENYFLSRFEGGKFVILLPEILEVEGIKELSKKILSEFKQPVILDNKGILTEPNIGVSFYPEDGKNFDELMSSASLELKKSKEYLKEIVTPAKGINAKKWITLETDLQNALKRDEFIIYYQPQIEVKTNKVKCVEALLRWKNKRYGIIQPSDFIPMAESAGLIYNIGLWVLKNAIAQTAKWHLMGHKISIAVNLSNRQLNRTELLAEINSYLKKYGLHPNFLNLEITENTVMENFDNALKMMKIFDNSGIRISIDDFGTGYSSLKHLKHFPVKTLKVDKSFVKEIPKNTEDIAVTRTILSLSKNLGLKVVAEGVETKAQFDFMKGNGCDYIQGFYFSKPLDTQSMTNYLKDN